MIFMVFDISRAVKKKKDARRRMKKCHANFYTLRILE